MIRTGRQRCRDPRGSHLSELSSLMLVEALQPLSVAAFDTLGHVLKS